MLRLAVIGAGVMGTNHARVAAQVGAVTLTHVVDTDLERAAAAASRSGATPVASVDEIGDEIDAAVVALPTPLHAPTAVPLLEAGIHCLVEKPIAPTLAAADEIIAAAERGGATLMVGHVERFNPAVLELDNLLDDVIHIDAWRVGPFSARVGDGVVMDLMIHDLDLVAALADSEVESVSAVTRVVRTDSEDLCAALLTFDNGVTANLTASRLGQQKIRELRIHQQESFLNVDLLRRDVTVHRVSHNEYVGDEGTRYRQSGIVEIPMLEHQGEPLALEQAEFAAAITESRPPRVDGAAGRRALELVLRVVEAAG